MDVLPAVVGIGYPKAATTYLADVLAKHPEVAFSSRKETHFFERTDIEALEPAVAAARYGDYWPTFNPARHRIAMEWTVTYVTDVQACDRIKLFYSDRRIPLFLIASRDPIRSVLSSYFYHRTISNDQHAARLSQHACLDRHPEVYVEPYRYARHFEAFRERFPLAPVTIVPYARLRRDPDGLFTELFAALGLSSSEHWKSVAASNVPYPYKSWLADKFVRWTLVRIYGNERTKRLYSRPAAEKPRLFRLLHQLNRGTYAWEPGAEDRVRALLIPDFVRFTELVTKDQNCHVLGTESDLRGGLI